MALGSAVTAAKVGQGVKVGPGVSVAAGVMTTAGTAAGKPGKIWQAVMVNTSRMASALSSLE